jgi:serine kinase of HPr protein (carbohydrate metabolism regulator)
MAMTEFTIELAQKRIHITSFFESTMRYCKAYLCDGDADFSVVICQEDIDFERRKSAAEDELEGLPVTQYSDRYLETLAVYRKIAEKMVEFDTLLFHGSVIAVDDEAFLFTATSGTGKSTHTRLWREAFGNRAVMVNDDKPMLIVRDGKVLVCGTPWDGKHRLSTNMIVPLTGICILERGEQNSVTAICAKEALQMILQQSYRPQNLMKYLEIIENLTVSTNLYRLKCNMDPEAAQVAYLGMSEKGITV